MEVIIIGGGIAGLTSAHILKEAGIEALVIEKTKSLGGLSKSFEMEGEYFDIGGHASFAKDPFVRSILEKNVDFFAQKAVAYNYKAGKWIKNPVQINLAALDTKEKISILTDYINRPLNNNPQNYYEWLETHYGRYFTDNYPSLYTRKYWTVEPEMLETKWVGVRMYQPTIQEVLYGAFEKETEEVHYSGEIRYPVTGGFEHFINNLEAEANVRLSTDIDEIDFKNKIIRFNNGETGKYDAIINTAPLPSLVPLIKDVPTCVSEAASALNATSLILISICLRGKLKTDLSPGYYIYDSDIPATRVYSTTKYSGTYKGNTALQAEVFISKFRNLDGTIKEIGDRVISQLADIGMYDIENVVCKDVRFEKYANIIFTPDIYENRQTVRDFLEKNHIICAGRFGEWDYLWTDQAMLSGKKAAEKIIELEKNNERTV